MEKYSVTYAPARVQNKTEMNLYFKRHGPSWYRAVQINIHQRKNSLHTFRSSIHTTKDRAGTATLLHTADTALYDKKNNSHNHNSYVIKASLRT